MQLASTHINRFAVMCRRAFVLPFLVRGWSCTVARRSLMSCDRVLFCRRPSIAVRAPRRWRSVRGCADDERVFTGAGSLLIWIWRHEEAVRNCRSSPDMQDDRTGAFGELVASFPQERAEVSVERGQLVAEQVWRGAGQGVHGGDNVVCRPVHDAAG